jgi:uncharacterized protein (TIGR00730 family)
VTDEPINHDLDRNERDRLLQILKGSAAYRVAYEDIAFLNHDDLRPVRLQLELLKPETLLRLHNIRTTIVVFGSARTLPPDVAQRHLDSLLAKRAKCAEREGDSDLERQIHAAERQLEYSRYYEEARRFARIVSTDFQEEGRADFVVVTGGGPGMMEAANRGAYDVGAMSAGMNITIPAEQEPNPYISPELCFRFHYFAIRKMHFLMRAKALVSFPGGFGTMDELFEALTLVQTMKIAPMPIVLVGRDFWSRAVDFDFLVEQGMIGASDKALCEVVDTAEEAVKVIYDFYGGGVPD